MLVRQNKKLSPPFLIVYSQYCKKPVMLIFSKKNFGFDIDIVKKPLMRSPPPIVNYVQPSMYETFDIDLYIYIQYILIQ